MQVQIVIPFPDVQRMLLLTGTSELQECVIGRSAPQAHCIGQDGPTLAFGWTSLDACVHECDAFALVRAQVAADIPGTMQRKYIVQPSTISHKSIKPPQTLTWQLPPASA